MQIKDKVLFLKYAFPCSSTLVNRKWISQDKVSNMLENLKKGKVKENINDIYLVATSECKLMALRQRKKEIDEKVIRDYFLDRHDEVVDRRFREMGDFDPGECRTYPGKVIVARKNIKLLTPKGVKMFRNSFVDDLRVGDYVVTHFDFIIEKISREKSKDLWDRKKQYIKKGFVGFE